MIKIFQIKLESLGIELVKPKRNTYIRHRFHPRELMVVALLSRFSHRYMKIRQDEQGLVELERLLSKTILDPHA